MSYSSKIRLFNTHVDCSFLLLKEANLLFLQDRLNFYTCHCAPGYYGVNCETAHDECASTPCKNDAVCTVSPVSWQ